MQPDLTWCPGPELAMDLTLAGFALAIALCGITAWFGIPLTGS